MTGPEQHAATVRPRRPRSNQSCQVCRAERGIEHDPACPWALLRAAEARADELQRERDEARKNADGMARAPYGEFEGMREARDEARREADQLRAVVDAARVVSEVERTGVLPDFQPLADALAALAGVQADTITVTPDPTLRAYSRNRCVQADNKDST